MQKKKEKGFPIHRTGSKKNDIKHFIDYLPKDINTIIEPFGGGFAVTRLIYYDKKYKKIVNDSDENLFYVYCHIDELKKMCEYFMEYVKPSKDDKTRNKKQIDEIIDKCDTVDIRIKNYFKNEFVRGRIGVSPLNINNLFSKDTIGVMDCIEFKNQDYKKLLEKYKKDSNAFIFLDPPYLFSNNTYYSPQNDGDMTDIIAYIHKFMIDKNTKCKVMMIINKLKIIKYIFNDMVKGEYKKIYSLNKTNASHYIITNY